MKTTENIDTIALIKRECCLCPRLVAFRYANKIRFPKWHNAPVQSFGCKTAWLLVVGLAPGLQGANRTGRPFTGDFAGILLYTTLKFLGFAAGSYQGESSDSLFLKGCRITNAVRCVPPANTPLTEEIRQCRAFLKKELASMSRLRIIVVLGRVAHESILLARGLKKSALPFRHGTCHQLDDGLVLADSYHCSRYNVQTGRLTEEMFHDVFRQVLTIKEKYPD